MRENPKVFTVLTLDTLAFTVCFVFWMINGVLVTFFIEHGTRRFSLVTNRTATAAGEQPYEDA